MQSLTAVTEQTRSGLEEQKSETLQIITATQEMTFTVQKFASNAGQPASPAPAPNLRHRPASAT